MITEILTYTDSSMSDKIKQFFNEFKSNDCYKYVDLIDSRIIQSKVIEIDYDEFSDKIKQMLENQSKERIHKSIYRAIGELFQVRFGSAELENVKQEDILKFKIDNFKNFENEIFSNPKFIYYEHYDSRDYEGIDKIDNVAKELQKKYRFVTLRKTDEILLYNGKIYDRLQSKTIIREETEKLIPNCMKHHREEVISKIKAKTYTDIENFDVNPNLITLENGILDLETLVLKPHTPNHLSRVLLPVEYHEPKYDDIQDNLKNTVFWKYLTTSFTVDGKFRKEDFETVLEIIASPIVKRHIDEKAFMFLGNGENGKSVCLGYVESLLGKNNVAHIPLQKISSDKHMSADLDGISANIFSDLEKNELRHTGEIKDIVSGEGLQVQKKYKDPFTLYPFCKLMFSCNRFPKSFDQSQGFFRRWIIVKWDRNFEGDPERTEYLREKLDSNQEEKNHVFSNLVIIANRLYQKGKFTHTKDWKTIQKEWNANADPLHDFATNYIIYSEGDKSKIETYQFYKDYCFEKGEIPMGIGKFGKSFTEYYEDDRENRKRIWLNIDFKRPSQTTLDENDNS